MTEEKFKDSTMLNSVLDIIHCIAKSSSNIKIKSLIEEELKEESDITIVTQKLSLWILDPELTEIIGLHLRPWLLEILGWSKNLVGSQDNPANFDVKAHTALCMTLSKLLFITDEIKCFVGNYFKRAPSPHFILSQDTLDKCRKRPKISYRFPEVTETEVLHATYIFVSHCDSSLYENWDCAVLLKYLKHKDEKVRWLACNCVASLTKMSEYELKMLVEKCSSQKFDIYMTVNSMLQLQNTSRSVDINGISASQEYTCQVGKVLLPLCKAEQKQEDGLIALPSTCENLEAIALAINSSSPVLVEGIVGGGKTYLIEHIANITGRGQAPELSKVQLSDQTDSKTLIGTYICTSNPGEFIWQAGSLTQALKEGHWLLLEDIDFAPKDVISLLIPVLESRTLLVPGHGNIRAHPNFQVFATRRILPAGCPMRAGSACIIEKLWSKVSLKNLTYEELKELIKIKWKDLTNIADKLVEVFTVLSYGQHGKSKLFEGCQHCGSLDLTSAKASGRFVSLRDLNKWCSRMALHIDEKDLHLRAFQEALDCFCAAVPDVQKRYLFALHIGSHLNMNEPAVNHYFYKYKPEMCVQLSTFSVGSRGQLPRRKKNSLSLEVSAKTFFSKTRLSSCLLEKVTVAIMNKEPVLIIGETGTGKTSTVQYLAQQTNHSLRVINMNQQSDSADLLGGFRPVEKRTIIAPVRQEFEDLFSKTFSVKENTKYLGYIMRTFDNQNWNKLFVLIDHANKEAVRRLKTKTSAVRDKKELKTLKVLNKKWKNFEFKFKTLKDQVIKAQSPLAFAFLEGTLVRAVQRGDWVLLDEINLASADTLECMSGLLESLEGSITLHERGDSKPIVRHPEFRLFACMNPATDVGKKELPAGLRNRFSEFFMEEFEDKDDLMLLVHDYLQEFNPPPKQIEGIVIFYLRVRELAARKLSDGTGHKPHFSLRTLCRALVVARKNPCRNFQRSLYEAFCLSFLTQLDRTSYPLVIGLIKDKIFAKKEISGLRGPIPCPGKEEEFIQVEGFWVSKGDKKPQTRKKYIITPAVKSNLQDLARIVSIGRFPVLLQGDTSVGKTSLISYLAELTGNACVRINNHQHTDLQEYIGSYASDESGKLVFNEGVLVKAMRSGHWVILDELNLAPTEVLEALNRLLDDNRELFIPEIETTVKAHHKFMLFATQNPPGVYGGRKVLSRAFRNRFIELHFDLIPSEELETILHRRCDISLTHCMKMIKVLKDLLRMLPDISQGKQSFMTLRDLFRWAERYRLAPEPPGKYYDWDQHIADEGFLVLAGRTRSEKEAETVKMVLEQNLKRTVEAHKLFDLSPETSSVTKSLLENLSLVKGFEHIVWTRDMRRLFVLASKALMYGEPVLLVGETGCGKTTVCQLIAALKQQQLFTINCHMHTEGADFLGGLRPVRERSLVDDGRLFEWVDGPLIQSMRSGGMFLADEISLADDSVLERLNSLLEPERSLMLSEKGSSQEYDGITIPEILIAHNDFRLIGTMNPGGDYGKKELSPALRNRFTEIWCPKVEISRSAEDIQLIIDHNLSICSMYPSEHTISKEIITFLSHFSSTALGKKCTVSIRDILSWVSFINKLMKEHPTMNVGLAYIHGACLILLDSLGSGETGSTVFNWKQMRQYFMKYLYQQARLLSVNDPDISALNGDNAELLTLINDETAFGLTPFVIPKGPLRDSTPLLFSFEAPRTSLNLLRLLRGLQLSHPVLLEGSPGVGKTSLVTALAKASGNEIVRINLSEQTDVSDLFGADLPEEGSEGGRFSWRDGPLLQALKSGAWVVLDELNLASQSVLEGLNACFDHRGEVFVPELNKTFKVQRDVTRIFACQNPQYQGGARKGLPKSFLNRFTQVYMEPLSSDDLEFILKTMHPSVPPTIILKMVKFNETLVHETQDEGRWGNTGGPWEFNLRDMFRWCELMLKNQSSDNLNPGEYVELIYSDRMRKPEDKDVVLDIYNAMFGEEFPLYRKSGKFFICQKKLQVGHATLYRQIDGCEKTTATKSELFLLHGQTPYLESIINCVNMNWMTILVGDSGEGKTCLVHLLANLVGRRLERLTVNSQMDVTELLGGFEQADYGCQLAELLQNLESVMWREVRHSLLELNLTTADEILQAWKCILTVRSSGEKRTVNEEAEHIAQICQKVHIFIENMSKKFSVLDLREMKRSFEMLRNKVTNAGSVCGGGTFEWVDSPLVKAVRNGHWLLIDGVNLCSPSVLDRLNGLLEPEGVLTINERGVIGDGVPTVKPHLDFRIFLTMDPQQGEISRAMRNRGIEICMTGIWNSEVDMNVVLLSQGLTDIKLQNILKGIHFRISEALPSYEKPTISALGHAALLMKQLLQLGQTPYVALKQSLTLTYSRNFGKTSKVKNTVKVVVKGCLKDIDKKFLKKLELHPPVNRLVLSSRVMENNSNTAYAIQFLSLVEAVEMVSSKKISPSSLALLTLPAALPSSSDSLLSTLFIGLASTHLAQWDIYVEWAKVHLPADSKLMKAIITICGNVSLSFKEIVSLTSEELPADPRFNRVALSLKMLENNLLIHLANKALIGLWFSIRKEFQDQISGESKQNRTNYKGKKKDQSRSILELSKAIWQGSVSGKMIYHPSLKYIYLLLEAISKLIAGLADNINISFSNDDYFKVREALYWRERFKALCQRAISKESFHLFLPELVFHWQKLQDILLNSIPPHWQVVVPEELTSITYELKKDFQSHFTPLHDIIHTLRNNLGNPLPFVDKESASLQLLINKSASSFVPYLSNHSINSFLASEAGFEAKCVLINAMLEHTSEKPKYGEFTEQLQTLERNISSELSEVDSNGDSAVSAIQLWPVLDYFVYKQLCYTEAKLSEPKISIISCKDYIAKSPHTPVQCLSVCDNSQRLAKVSLYLYSITNCAVKQPGKWLNYSTLQQENEMITEHKSCWEGEETVILNPMGCLLTYLLLTGFYKPEKEIVEMSVGRHSEREKQLNTLRSTIFRNWNQLSDFSSSYTSCFKESVINFVIDLYGALLTTLKLQESEILSHDYLGIMKIAERALCDSQHLLGTEGSQLLHALAKQREHLETTPTDILEIAKLGIYSGLLQSWLLSHTEPLDPAQQRNLMLSYCKKELEDVEDTLLIYKWVELLRYSHSEEQMHPHTILYRNRQRELQNEVKILSDRIAYRPVPSQYVLLTQDIAHFMSTVFLPSRIADIVQSVLSSCVDGLKTVLQQCEGMLLSCDNFIYSILNTYPLYRDLTTTLLHSVSLTCESIRVLMVLCQYRDLCFSSKLNLADSVGRMLSFPLKRDILDPSKILSELCEDQRGICRLFSAHASKKAFADISQSLCVRANIYDLYNVAVSEGCVQKVVFSFFLSAAEKVISWWKEQEEEKKGKEEEEASLFKYKARTLAVSETEEEEIEREYKVLFPDYNDEFRDLDNVDADNEPFTQHEKDETEVAVDEVIKLSSDHLEELIECHRLLTTSLTATSWLSAHNNLDRKTLTPALLRTQQVQLLLRLVGPNIIHQVDEAALGSLIISNYASCASAKLSIDLSLIKKPYNYYHDPVPEEALKIRPLLKNLKMKTTELLDMWPSHPSLIMINKVINRVLDFPVTSPLIRFVIGLEAVLEKSHEWEKNAHKGVSLMTEISPITDQILEWRKMELKAWRSCLEMITYKVSSEANKYWPYLFETLTSLNSEDATDLIKPLKQFMERAVTGDYERRLQILFSFHCHLALESLNNLNSSRKSAVELLISITWNFYKYYSQFLPFVKDALEKNRKPIEKKVTDFIKILRWNDINFFSVKESVIKNRRTLHRHMRMWEKILRQPAGPVLRDTNLSLSDTETVGQWDKEKTSREPQIILHPMSLVSNMVPGACSESLLSRLPSLTKKCTSFITEIFGNMSYVSNIEALEELTEQIIVTYQDLHNATLRAENIAEKGNRLKQMKAVMHQKRESLATLLKSLNHIGVSYTKGNILFKENDLDSCLTVPPLDVTVSHGTNKSLHSTCLSWESCEKYYYRSIGRHALLLNSLTNAHSDLGPELIKRVKGSACHLLLFAKKLRKTLPAFSSRISEMKLMVNEIQKAGNMYFPMAKNLGLWWSKLNSYAVSLSLTLDEEKHLLEAFTETDPLVIIQPAPTSAETVHVQESVSILKEAQSELQEVIHTCLKKQHFTGDVSYKLPSEENIIELKSTVDSLSSVSQMVSGVVAKLNPAPQSKMGQCLIQWLSSWETVEAEFEDWTLNLVPFDETSCEGSEQIDTCLIKVLLGIEGLYKTYCKREVAMEDGEDPDKKLLISEGMVTSLLSDIRMLRLEEVQAVIFAMIDDLKESADSSALIALKAMVLLLQQYVTTCENIFAIAVACSRSVNKLLSVILAIYQQLATKGFCRPQDLTEQDGEAEGATQFEDSGPGLTEGDGQKDVSDRFETEDQLESALQEGQQEQAGDRTLREEDGIELSQDFEGIQQNIEKMDAEDQQDSTDDNESDNEFDKEMGETEKGADKLDEKLWGDEDDEKTDEENHEKEDMEEYGPGAVDKTESELVAKDDNKNQKEIDNREEKKKKELEVMEEDRREHSQENEEETYDDNYRDKFGGEDQTQDEDGEQMDLPDNLKLDGKEKDEGSEDEIDLDMNPEIEEKPLFPEEEPEPKASGLEDDAKDTEGGDESEVADSHSQEQVEEQADDESEMRKDKTRFDNETGDNEDNASEEQNEDAVSSQDTKAEEAAEAAAADTENASKDKTKDVPDTAVGAQPVEDEEFKQDEQGKIGEQTDDMTGVGQSDSKTRDNSHKAQTSALTNEEQAEQKRDEENRPRKPGDVDQARTLGDIEKEIHHGLMTKKASGPKKEREQDEEKVSKDEADNKDPENRDAAVYEHVNMASYHYDKQTVDVGTHDEAKLRPAPAEEDEDDKEEEQEGITDTLMDEYESKEETQLCEETKKRPANTEELEGPDEKRSRVDLEVNSGHTEVDYDLKTEGDIVREMVVQRPPQNEFYTLMDDDGELHAAFSEDLAGVRERIQEADEGDIPFGADNWTAIEGKVSSLSLQLCEQLRIILEPTEASKLKGDYRTGKRLNMRKVIPFIASQFRKDKIWLRRTQPNKRSYQVLLAVDDSESMQRMNAETLAKESVALVAKALTLLEVGQVGVISFGSDTKILHPLHKPFSDHNGAKVFANLRFDQDKTDYAKMLEDAVALLEGARGGGTARPDIAQLLLILSDGQVHSRREAVRAAVKACMEAKVFVIFLILDALDNQYSFYDRLSWDNEKLEVQKLVEIFPFRYFLVVRDLQGLPETIAAALRQWFQLVTADTR